MMRRRQPRLARVGIPTALVLALVACLNPRPEDDPFREGDGDGPGAENPGAAGTPAVQPPDTDMGEPSNSGAGGAGGSASGGVDGGTDAPTDAGTRNDPDAGVQRDAAPDAGSGGSAEHDAGSG